MAPTAAGRDHGREIDQSRLWDAQAAAEYDTPGLGMFAPEVLGPAVDLLAELANGTGRAATLSRSSSSPIMCASTPRSTGRAGRAWAAPRSATCGPPS